MRFLRLAVAVVAAVLLAGCSAEDEPLVAPSPFVPSGDAVVPSSAPVAPVLEGDASSTARWPDGISARLVGVERVPNEWGSSVPGSVALIRVKVEVRNDGAGPLPIQPATRMATIYWGANRTEGEQYTGYAYKDPAEQKRKGLSLDGPTRIVPGSSAVFYESAGVPVGELGGLTVVVEVPAEEGLREPYTFTGVEKVLKTVK